MVIKRYIVNNMNEALTRIRYELGRDAVIISQRKIRKSGIKGFFSKRVIEVTAAVEKVDNQNKEKGNSIEHSINAIKKIMENEVSIDSSNNEEENKVTIDSSNNEEENKILKQMEEMKGLISDLVNSSSSNKSVKKGKLESKLEENDVNEKTIKAIINKINNNKENISDDEKLKQAIKKIVKVSKEKMNKVVVLVGPTGVGKTTTIAKLAGRLALIENKKVGLITVDTYRIGAVEQLRTYAEIMNIPFSVVLTIKDMERAIESMKNCDTILVDTTGRSSKNTMQISELRAFIDKTNTDSIHLVLSATTKNKDIETIIDGFKILSYTNVIITKLDETSTYGSIINILNYSKKPLSYVTVGQNVPDDIKIISSEDICNLVLGEDGIC